MFCCGLLCTPSCYPLCPSWQERAVPVCLYDCDEYLQSTADTALAEAGHHAAGQSSWTPERNCLWSVKELIPGSKQQGWGCALQPQSLVHMFSTKGNSYTQTSEPPWAIETTALRLGGSRNMYRQVRMPCISLPPSPVSKIPLQKPLTALHLPAPCTSQQSIASAKRPSFR